MRTTRYLNNARPTWFGWIPFQPDGVAVTNYTTRAVYLHIGRDTIPSAVDYDALVPAGGTQILPVSWVQAFAAALDTAVADSAVTTGIPLQCELLFATKDDLPQPGSAIASRTGKVPADVMQFIAIPVGLGVPVNIYTTPARLVSTIQHGAVDLFGSTNDDQVDVLIGLARNAVAPMGTATLFQVYSNRTRHQVVERSFDVDMREGDIITMNTQNADVAPVNIRVSFVITANVSP